MSKQTTTDFEKKVLTILANHNYSFAEDIEMMARDEDRGSMFSDHDTLKALKSVVSELVEECLGEDEPKILIHDDGTEWVNILGIAINEKLAEIRQRLKERGMTIK